jgi:uncharacterized protein YkwD
MGCFQVKNSNDFINEFNHKNIEIEIYKFSKNALEQHNKYRKEHNTEPLELDNDLQIHAQKHAEKIANEGKEFHSNCKLKNGEIIGENIYSNGTLFTGKEMTDNFYNDIEYYNFNNPKDFINASRFTQLIWVNTKKVGFGIALSQKNGKIYSVANYYPSGNYIGEYEGNVNRKNIKS